MGEAVGGGGGGWSWRPWRRPFLLVLAPVLLASPPTRALDLAKALTQYGYDHWTSRQGLPVTSVEVLAQTPDGYLWIGTDEGLVRFDGNRFTVYDQYNTPGLTNHLIRALYPRRAGGLWVGTWNGLFLLQGGKATAVPVVPEDPFLIMEALFESADGTLWVGTQGHGVVRLNHGAPVRYGVAEGLPDAVIWSLQEDREGALWIGTHTGLARLRNGRVEDLTAAMALPTRGSISSFALAPDGTLWIGSPYGVLHYEGEGAGERRFRRLGKAEGLPSELIDSLALDAQGSLWIGSRIGVSRLHRGTLSHFGVADGLADRLVRALQVDPEGSLWIGTQGGGLERLRDGKFTLYGKPEGLANSAVNTLLQDRRGDLWFGTRRGLSRRHSGKTLTWSEADGVASEYVTSLLEARDGTLWVGTAGGLSRSRGPVPGESGGGKAFEIFRPDDRYLDTFISGLFEDREGGLWIASSYGHLYRWANGERKSFGEQDGWDSAPISCLLGGRAGELWICTTSGLSRYRDGAFTRFGAAEGLSDLSVYSLYQDAEGTLWIGTLGGGLNRLRNGKIHAFRADVGLRDNTVLAIQEDASGNLWLGSNRGLARVAKRELDEVAAGKRKAVSCTLFGIADGLRGQAMMAGSFSNSLRDRSGHLWFGMDDSAVEVDPLHLPINRRPPPVVIEGLTVDATAREPRNHLVLPPGSQRLEIGYTALTALAPERVSFKVQLIGFDRTWVDAGGRRLATYTNLPPGDYSFRVRAANADGVWNPRAAVLAFTLAPRVHQTLWFRLLVLGLFLATLFGLYRLRTRSLAARFEAVVEERTRIARELHDTLMQGLAGVSLQIENAADVLGEPPPPAWPYLERARSLVRETLSAARRSVWNLRAKELENRSLAQAIEVWIAAQDGQGPPVHFRLHGRPRPLPERVEEHLFRIAHEAIANAVQHAKARQVGVDLTFGERELRLKVVDDGLGFVEAAGPSSGSEPHFGLLGMRDRAREVDGWIEVKSVVGRGTEVQVDVPIA